MKKILFALLILASLVFLSGCASSGGKGGELTGIYWQLTSLNDAAPIEGTGLSARFLDGRVSGSAGCNRYNGTYTVNGSQIEFGEAMASTMMACDEAVMQQEQAYFKALAEAKSFTATAEKLTLMDSGGKVLAEYSAVSQELAGTSWLANSYNNGQQAVVSVVIDSELTAEFSTDGSVSGSSGCNTFTGGYTVDGEKITIGPLATTMMACEQDLMDQEAQYLLALQSAAVYSIEGNTLQLRTADDALAAMFDRK